MAQRIQLRPVEPAVVLQPAPHNRIDPPRELARRPVRVPMQPPTANLTVDALLGILADCGRKRAEELSILVPCLALPEFVPQERKRRVLIPVTTAVPIMAIHDFVLSGCNLSPTSAKRSPIPS